MLYSMIRKIFFSLDAELAHGLGMSGVDFLNRAGIVSPMEGLIDESIEQGVLIGSPNQVEAIMSNMEKRPAKYANPKI